MIALLIFLVVLAILWRLLYPIIIGTGVIFIGLILSVVGWLLYSVIKGIWNFFTYKQIQNIIDKCCTEQSLNKMSKEDRLRLAQLIEVATSKKMECIKEAKDNLIAAAAGWTIADMGFSQTVK